LIFLRNFSGLLSQYISRVKNIFCPTGVKCEVTDEKRPSERVYGKELTYAYVQELDAGICL
jgi:hypothetical protein